VTAQTLRGDVAVLVPAAGAGVRLGPGGPKALRELGGEPLLVHAVRRLCAAASIGQVVVSAPAGSLDAVRALLAFLEPVVPVVVVAGGASRQLSVAAALAAADPALDIVLVHDAARALAPPALIERVAAAVRAGCPAVVPVLPVIDTIKQVDGAGRVLGTVDRAVLRAVQTPQGFRRDVLVAAHAAATDEHTDDAGLAEKIGVTVHTVDGDEAALKITRPADLRLAELFLRVP
jgi:2-C-methyl-D-erythritol 4-phosphate cytidylyltransferase